VERSNTCVSGISHPALALLSEAEAYAAAELLGQFAQLDPPPR